MSHPINPPHDLIHNWCQELKVNGDRIDLLLIKAARWGADQELEACVELVRDKVMAPWADDLRAARRPKPPSLKQQALEALDSASYQPYSDFKQIDPGRSDTIRRALEALPDD